MNKIWAIRVGTIGIHETYYLPVFFETREDAREFKRNDKTYPVKDRKYWNVVRLTEKD
jgi:hypothetical protein